MNLQQTLYDIFLAADLGEDSAEQSSFTLALHYPEQMAVLLAHVPTEQPPAPTEEPTDPEVDPEPTGEPTEPENGSSDPETPQDPAEGDDGV